jgi:hypothetical protein
LKKFRNSNHCKKSFEKDGQLKSLQNGSKKFGGGIAAQRFEKIGQRKLPRNGKHLRKWAQIAADWVEQFQSN